jgi:arylsulfatase A-like enzyme
MHPLPKALVHIFSALALLSHVAVAAPKPNVLFIAVDDLNDYVSILDGHPQAKTPNLDRLAKMGMNFTSAHTASPVCNSSRCALMTGRHPFKTGIYANGQPSAKTVASHGSINREFLQNGYHTAGSGKIYHSFHYAETDWSELKARFPWPKIPRENLIEIGGQFDQTGIIPDELENQTGDYLTAQWVAERLRSPKKEPFFLACGIYRPHVVWQVPQKYFDLFPEESIILPKVQPNDLDDIPAFGRRLALSKEGGDGDDSESATTRSDSHPHADIVKAGHWKRGVRAYLAAIAYADAQIGQVLDALESSPARDNTIVVLFSDHGWHNGEKHHWRKATLWEESTRVPFIIVAPGIAKPGSNCDRVVSLIDIYPTLRDLCGLDGKSELCGESLRPLLADPSSTATSNHAFTTYIDGAIAIRTPDARYIRYPDQTEEYYDRTTDPNEWTNLAKHPEHAEKIATIRKLGNALAAGQTRRSRPGPKR